MDQNTNSVEQEVVLDDEFFKNYSKGIKEEESKKKFSGNFSSDYETMKWCGTTTGENQIVRLIGVPPGAKGVNRRAFDPIILGVCDVKDDEGKRMQVKLPPRAEEPMDDHIVYRLYDRVNEVTWIKGNDGKNKKVFVNEAKHPELFEAVNKTGFNPAKDGKSYTYANGLKAQQCVVFNCVDRMDDWCKDNKHTKLLSKQVDVVTKDDGSVAEYAKTGVPIFGFVNKVADLVGKYGNYEKYDVAIKRTGQMTSPYEVRNASKMKQVDNLEELQNDNGEDVQVDRIVVGLMTEEELHYERYDLTKIFQPTGYRKLLKRLGKVFKLCDATLGTTFEDELKKKADVEQKEWDAKAAEQEETQTSTEQTEVKKAVEEVKAEESFVEEETAGEPETPAEQPMKRRVGPAIQLDTDKIALLKGWPKLSEREKAGIKDVIVKDGKVVKLEFTSDIDTKEMLECPDCNVTAPSSYETTCPVCACRF